MSSSFYIIELTNSGERGELLSAMGMDCQRALVAVAKLQAAESILPAHRQRKLAIIDLEPVLPAGDKTDV